LIGISLITMSTNAPVLYCERIFTVISISIS
jgi:hypothetical protein